MKHVLLGLLLVWITGHVYSQVGINTDASEPDASAMLDVKSSEKGLLIPRMTTVEKLAIFTPAEGLMVYDTDLGSFCYYHNSAWETIGAGGETAGWSLTGNMGIDPTTQFIGTNDTARLVFRVNNSPAGLLERNGVTLFGCYAGFNNRASLNTFIGNQAGLQTTTGNWNTALGYQSFFWNSTGYSNTALGVYSLQNNQTGNYNLAVGHQSLGANQTGCYNTALGALSSIGIVNGQNNTTVGYLSLGTNQSGNNNTTIGAYTDVSAGDITNAVAIGYSSIASASHEVRLGNTMSQTLYCQGAWEATSGNTPNMVVNNIGQIMRSTASLLQGKGANGRVTFWADTDSLGSNADLFWDNSNGRFGIGTNAPGQTLTVDGTFGLLETGASPTYHTIFQGGDQAADITYTLPVDDGVNGQVLATDGNGVLSWASPTTADITAVGSMTSGDVFASPAADNQWLGLGAAAGRIEFDDETIDEVNILNAKVGIGTSTPTEQLELTGNLRLPVSTSTTGIIYAGNTPFIHNVGSRNNFMGQLCGNLLLSGAIANSAVGDSALFSISSGDFNIAFGEGTLKSATTAPGNIAIGHGAGRKIISNGYNTIIGYQAGVENTADRNTFLGCESGFKNTTGHYNAFVGHQAGYKNTTANNSVAIGYRALYNQTGEAPDNDLNNTAIGYEASRENTTGHYNTSLGYNALSSNTAGDENTAVGYNADVLSNNLTNTIAIGSNAKVNASNKAVIGNASITTVGGYGDWVNYSDRRLKENILYRDELGLGFIMKLETVSYNYTDDKNKRRRDGMIAQDVQEALNELGLEFSGLIIDNDSMQTMNLSYGEFVIPLINAMKEQQQLIDYLSDELKELKRQQATILKAQEELLQRLNDR